MFKFLLFVFIFSQIYKSLQYDYLTFNDNFTYINCSDCNETKKALNIYLGNELIFLKIENPKNTKGSHFTFNESGIEFSFENETLNFSYNNTKVYFKGDYLFTFGEKLSNGTFINKLDISLPKENNYLIITDKNITFENISYIILSGDGEYLFIQKPFFSFILALSGFMII